MTDFNNLHRILEVAKITTPEYDDDYGEIQTILDLYEAQLKIARQTLTHKGEQDES